MDTTLSFDTKDALVTRLRALAVVGGELEKVTIEEAWPAGRINSRDTVIVGDVDGDQRPATLRAGGGTRDDVFRIDIAAAAVRKTGDAKPVRDRAKALAGAVERLVVTANAEQPSLGIARLRKLTIVRYRVAEFVHDKGRECDVHLSVEFTGRLTPGA